MFANRAQRRALCLWCCALLSLVSNSYFLLIPVVCFGCPSIDFLLLFYRVVCGMNHVLCTTLLYPHSLHLAAAAGAAGSPSSGKQLTFTYECGEKEMTKKSSVNINRIHTTTSDERRASGGEIMRYLLNMAALAANRAFASAFFFASSSSRFFFSAASAFFSSSKGSTAF